MKKLIIFLLIAVAMSCSAVKQTTKTTGGTGNGTTETNKPIK